MRYKPQDLVRVRGGPLGIVNDVKYDPFIHEHTYEVVFIDEELIPPSMQYPERLLKKATQEELDSLINKYYTKSSECECGLKGKKVPKNAHSRWCPLG